MDLPTYITGTVQTRAYGLLRENVYGVLSKYELTPTHWSLLGVVMEARDGIRQSEIAQAMNVKPPLVTVLVRELEQRDIIKTAQNQFDSRAKLVTLTAQGKKFVKTTEVVMHKSLSQLLSGLTENDLVTYNKVLTTIITNGNRIKKTGV